MFDCAGSSLMNTHFLQLQQVEATLQLWSTSSTLWWSPLWNIGSRAHGLQQLQWAQQS